MGHQRVAIVGLGNCASALLQGVALYRAGKRTGQDLGLDPVFPDCALDQVSFACAFDIDRRKIGRPVTEAVFARPNCVPDYGADLRSMDMEILRGPTLDGIAPTMAGREADEIFICSEVSEVDVVAALRRHRVTLVLCMLPTGAHRACQAYAQAACEAGTAFANGSATPVAALPHIRDAFRTRGLSIIGDDFKSQFGATYLNEVLIEALAGRRCTLRSSTQSNIGGNTDFLNMLDQARGEVKERSKLKALEHLDGAPGVPEITASIAGYRPELGDRKIAELVLTAQGFAGRPLKMSVTLEVEDSPNAAGIITTLLCGMAHATVTDAEHLGALVSTLTMKNPWKRVPGATPSALFPGDERH